MNEKSEFSLSRLPIQSPLSTCHMWVPLVLTCEFTNYRGLAILKRNSVVDECNGRKKFECFTSNSKIHFSLQFVTKFNPMRLFSLYIDVSDNTWALEVWNLIKKVINLKKKIFYTLLKIIGFSKFWQRTFKLFAQKRRTLIFTKLI